MNYTKKNLHNPDNHDGMINHLEPDILECKVKWALESITTNKASGGDGITAELFQILKVDAMKVLHSICQQIWKTQQWPQDWKRSVFIPILKKCNAIECSTTTQSHLFHMPARSCSKSSKLGSTVHELRTSRCSNWIEKRQRNQSSNCQYPLDHRKNKRIPEKHIFLLH